MFICCECCVLSGKRSVRRADHSSRGVLPTVVRRCVWSRNLMNEETSAHWGLSRQKQTTVYSEECFWQLFQTSCYFSLICKCLFQCAYPAHHQYVFWCAKPSFKFIEFNM